MVYLSGVEQAESTAVLTTALWAWSRKMPLPKNARLAMNTMMGAVVVQVTLGITTLIYMVPIELAAAHQAGALALLTSNFWLIHALRKVPLQIPLVLINQTQIAFLKHLDKKNIRKDAIQFNGHTVHLCTFDRFY